MSSKQNKKPITLTSSNFSILTLIVNLEMTFCIICDYQLDEAIPNPNQHPNYM